MKLLSKTLLPVPTKSCHASTLCTVPCGDGFSLLAAWFGGDRESADNVEIWLSRGEADGDGHVTRWSAPLQMSRTADEACWNPVLCADPRRNAAAVHRCRKGEVKSEPVLHGSLLLFPESLCGYYTPDAGVCQ